MAKMGRPQIKIDKKIFEGACNILCTLEDIAGLFGCSVDTIERWCQREYGESFAEVYKKHSAVGRSSLRRAQFKLAQKNAAMAIFLGKNYLGQRDHIEYTDTAALSRLDAILGELKGKADDEAGIQSEAE